ncbi:hypothetical protein PENTCL1PPCAC_3870, partial [Pristionchus entomophagus]
SVFRNMKALRILSLFVVVYADPLPLLPRDSLAMHAQMGSNMKSNLPGMGLLGYGDVVKSITRFTPDNNRYDINVERTYDADDRPNLGYMDRETTGARSTGSKSLMNLPGVGKFEYAEEREQGTGILDYSRSLFPYLQLPELKERHTQTMAPIFSMDQVNRQKYGVVKPVTTTPRPFSPFAPSLITEDLLPESERPPQPFQDIPSIVDEGAPVPAVPSSPPANQPDLVAELASDFIEANTISDNPFDDIALRERGGRGTIRRALPAADAAWIRAVYEHDAKSRVIRRKQVREQVNMLKAVYGAPASELGIDRKELRALCERFAPVAQQQCSSKTIAPEHVDKCRGFQYDCREFLIESKPLGAIANIFSSGVGMTADSWSINGIPYYALNEQGSIGGGDHGKLDFGSYGGGYSYNRGMRDLFTQSAEGGANWYEGVYGSKTGWSVPVAQGVGIEGGGGTMLTIPIKEGDFGKPMSASHGYHIGPYIGASEKVAFDWRDGGVSMNRGFAVPIAGVSVNTGTGFGFPGAAKILEMWSALDPKTWTAPLASSVSTVNGAATSEHRIYG